MKTTILSFMLYLFWISTIAQDLTISFQPKESGTIIDSIWVLNQRTNEKVKLTGYESLTLIKVTSINDFPLNSAEGCIYPNPCNGNTEMSFATSLNQEVKVNVYNLSGQLLSTESQFLIPGQHRFKILFSGTGIYTVSVLKNDGFLSYKAVCLKPEVMKCEIEYLGSQYPYLIKNSVAGKTLGYTQGDILLYSAFSGKNNTLFTDSPPATKVYSVDFYECKDQDNQNYPIVKIGTQVWMNKNLAYLPSVIPPTKESYTAPNYYVYGYSGNDVSAAKATASYSTYGVLYNWPAALTACPAGWHLPSDTEWKTLEISLGMTQTQADGTLFRGTDQGTQMKTTSGWNSNGNGTNSSGFSGLPGGGRGGDGTFNGIGYSGIWWSSSEISPIYVWSRWLTCIDTAVFRFYFEKQNGLSVRCLWDDVLSVTTSTPDSITNSSVYLGGKVTSDGGYAVTERGVCYATSKNPTTGSTKVVMGSGTGFFKGKVSGLAANSVYYVRTYAISSQGTVYGEQVTFTARLRVKFTDSRDGKTYNSVKIGDQWWMEENLAWLPSVSPPTDESNTAPYYYVYEYSGTDVTAAKATANYTTYGVLYNWPAALTACPAGWHLPSDTEWKTLEISLGMTQTEADRTGSRGTLEGRQMKSGSGWWYGQGNGTNSSCFSGLPGGFRGDDGKFDGVWIMGLWWSSAEYSTVNAWYGS